MKELKSSKIKKLLSDTNCTTLDGDAPYSYLNVFGMRRKNNNNAVPMSEADRYKHLEHGGWLFDGCDPVDGSFTDFCQFKPNVPYSKGDGKVIKYENPPGVETKLLACYVPWGIGMLTAKLAGGDIYQEYLLRFRKEFAIGDLDPELSKTKIELENRKFAKQLKKNKYKTESAKVDEGYWNFVHEHNLPLVITEGSKKAMSLQSIGYPTLGLCGIWNGARKFEKRASNGEILQTEHKLVPQLAKMPWQDRRVVFAFDQDSKPKTVKAVKSALSRLAWLLRAEGADTYFSSWTTQYKGIDDFHYAMGENAVHAVIEHAAPTDLLYAHKPAKFKDCLVEEQEKKYLEAPELILEQQFIGLKSPKGTGKTELVSRLLDGEINAGVKTLIITHREQLATHLAERIGIDYRSELFSRGSQTRGVLGYSLCIDSLHPGANPSFNPADWSGANIFIDEVKQVLWHLVNSSTCRLNRAKIIQTLTELLLTVLGSGGRLLVADADLDGNDIEYLRGLVGTLEITPYILENNYVPAEEKTAYLFNDSNPDRLIATAVEKVEQGQAILFAVSGQKAKTKTGTINLETLFKERFPEKNILRIDAETVSDPNHEAYGISSFLNVGIAPYDVVIYSPVLETGVSIDLEGVFDAVFCLAQGVQSVNAVGQTLARLRENVPRYVWGRKNASYAQVGNGATSAKTLCASTDRMTQKTIQMLMMAGLSGDEVDLKFSPLSLMYWAKTAAAINWEKKYHGTVLRSKLEADNYTVRTYLDENQKKVQEETTIVTESLKEIKKINYEAHCKAVMKAADITNEQFKKLSKQKAKTEPERLQEKKAKIKAKYQVPVTEELVKKDDDGWYSQLSLLFFLTVGYEFLKKRDIRVIGELGKQSHGKIFPVDVKQQTLVAKVQALKFLKIEQFLDSEAEFTKDSLEDWFKNVICPYRQDIKTIFGMTVNPETDSGIKVAQRFLRKLDLRLTLVTQKRIPSNASWKERREERHQSRRQRIYRGCSLDLADRAEIFSKWAERETLAASNFVTLNL